ncbi:MAG: FHA domain-containing protein [Phototrophicaceae bacterium]|jgi:pSer/pThr/pTyr-binding forkhead associated (FHA) protein
MSDESRDPRFNPEETFHRIPRSAVLSASRARAQQQAQRDAERNIAPDERQELILLIRGMVERLTVRQDTAIVLGRADSVKRFYPEVDLTPYGALDRGVSREHARLQVSDGQLIITDLGSTNGTFLAGERLEPNVPTTIQRGDELLLGRLAVQIMLR